MSIASILALVDGDEGSAAVIEAAFSFAAQHAAYLEVLHVQPDPRDGIPLIADGMTGAMVTQVMSEIRERGEAQAQEARRLFEEGCRKVDLPANDAEGHAPGRGRAAWRLVQGRAEVELAERGLLFDLLIVAQPRPEKQGLSTSGLEAGLFDVGGPLLVVPREFSGPVGHNVLVAWNGRREAARAITAALPMLQRAKQVTVVSIEETARAADPGQAAHRLALHHIQAEAHRIAGDLPAGEALLKEARERQADLIVMGAYGHSRLRQFVVGGVTRRLLAETPVPLLMAH
ncbi:MAG TPA: universal stress protein [Kiloniellales bacterium]|jgi:nucleotide-binding universal stress UspA family protein|nr:universal stress protein [Kiloniellales bacterium]